MQIYCSRYFVSVFVDWWKSHTLTKLSPIYNTKNGDQANVKLHNWIAFVTSKNTIRCLCSKEITHFLTYCSLSISFKSPNRNWPNLISILFTLQSNELIYYKQKNSFEHWKHSWICAKIKHFTNHLCKLHSKQNVIFSCGITFQRIK